VASHDIFSVCTRSVPREARRAKWGYTADMYFVYILKLKNGQHYVGFTENLEQRLEKHWHHGVPTTSRIEPIEVLFSASFKTKEKALAFEQYLKSSSGSAFRNKRLI
jgi:putative endonuclease